MTITQDSVRVHITYRFDAVIYRTGLPRGGRDALGRCRMGSPCSCRQIDGQAAGNPSAHLAVRAIGERIDGLCRLPRGMQRSACPVVAQLVRAPVRHRGPHQTAAS